jgi:hypothetical protein
MKIAERSAARAEIALTDRVETENHARVQIGTDRHIANWAGRGSCVAVRDEVRSGMNHQG